MLIAFLDTSQDDEPIEPSPGEVMFLVDRKLCLITDDGYVLPAEFVRIPLSVALSFAISSVPHFPWLVQGLTLFLVMCYSYSC